MYRIYVGNLSFQTTEQSLNELFSRHGKVKSVSIITDRVAGRSRGFGFIEMNDANEGRAALAAVNGKQLDGRALKVNEAKERSGQS